MDSADDSRRERNNLVALIGGFAVTVVVVLVLVQLPLSGEIAAGGEVIALGACLLGGLGIFFAMRKSRRGIAAVEHKK